MDDLSTKIREILCKKYNENSSVNLEDVFNKTNLLDICRLYTKKKDSGERVTFAVRDILDIVAHIAWKSDLDAVNEYVSLFSENGPAYKLKQRFDKEEIYHGFYGVTTNIRTSMWREAYRAKELEGVLEFLGSDQAVEVFSKYKSYLSDEMYEAVMSKAKEGIEQGKSLLNCLGDERVYSIFSDLTMTFPEEVFYKHINHSRERQFKLLVLGKAYETCDQEAVVEFARDTKDAWTQCFKQHPEKYGWL